MAKQKPKTPDDDPLPGVPTVAEAATDVAAAAETPVETPAEDSPSDELAGDEPAPAPELPAADEPAPAEPDADRPQKIDLVLKLDIALGNGSRKKGHRLGAFCCGVGVTLAEALALAADTQADCIVGEPPPELGFYPVTTRGAATVDERAFPPGSHVGNFLIPPESDTLRSEALQALRNFAVVCS